jgi:hypothetical protein
MVGALFAAPAAADPITMADLLAGATIVVGDKEFYGFYNYSSIATGPGATPVDPAQIGVLPVIEGSEMGIQFQSSNFFASTGQSQDTYFDFFVRILPGYEGWLISDNTLKMTGSWTGTGRASIAEVVRTADQLVSLADKLVVVDQTMSHSVDHKIFAFPVPAIHVAKDIGVVGGADGSAFVSDFSQTFSQVPEPVTLALLALGGLGTILGRKRK